MNEKISNKLLAIPITISFSIIIIFCFFLIGLSKVDAQSFDQNLYWDTPTWTQYFSGEPFATNGSTSAGQTVLKACNKTNECIAPDGFPMYALIGYNIPDNTTDSNITAFQEGDKFKFQAQFYWILTNPDFVPTDDLDFKFKITSGSAVYNAFCDVGENIKKTQVNDNPRTYEITYTCDVFNVDRPIRYFMFQLHTRYNIFSRVGVFENFRVIVSPLGVEDIISNADKNKDDIINNQNQNADKILGSLTDETAPNLDSFNDMSGWLPPGPLDSVLNLPLNVLNGLVGAFSSNTCSPISIPIPFIGGNIDLPCLYNLYSSINGLSVALTTFFTAIAGYLMFKYLSNLYVWIDETLKMEESDYMRDWGGV